MRAISCLFLLLSAGEGFSAWLTNAGIARIDITPSYSVPLSGYGNRTRMSDGVEQRIWAKALAFNPGTDDVAVLLTVDNCGVPFHVRREVLRRLKKIKPERFAILSSHTHSAPMLKGVLENIYSRDLTKEERTAMNRYTDDLTVSLVKVVQDAILNPIPARFSYGIGHSTMAENRRYGSGPTDDDVPVLQVEGEDGKILAVLANYACHCTAISGKLTKVCGDWGGYTQEFIEKQFPGSMAMIAIGCAGDQRPAKRFGLEYAKANGVEVGRAIVATLRGQMLPLDAAPACRSQEENLPLSPARPQAAWEKLAQNKNRSFAYPAQKNLQRIKRGEELQKVVPYYVQSWSFDGALLMVFLPGEVVVDYSVRLKHRYDRGRVWVNAYANDVPCYIPSERILREGGYEGESAMRYYDRPERFAPGVEKRILDAVAKTVPDHFEPRPKREIVRATDSTSHFTTKPGHYVQLVASEPQVVDPVVIDFGLDGRLWVAEMNDYPTGMDGDYQPGGRVKVLEDKDRDGFFETSTLFLEGIPFPTGITTWGEGVLVCAAPDILYAVDRDGDGKADDVRKLFTGFITDNYQARVNGIALGLDNWFYGSGGLRGGKIINLSNPSSQSVTIASKDFRFSTDFQKFEVTSGNSQQGRVRDDWDNWFGNNNSSSLFGYPMHTHYRNRNPHIFLPADRVYIPTGKEPERIYPTSELETRFNRPSHYNRVTSGCGPGIHRDSEVGAQYYGDAFICEPVHSVVRRLVLKPNGPVFTGHRAPDEKTSEFLSSSDNWFRPAQAKTGPDGAIWVVDMHRGLIEHPRWVPEDRLKQIDVRAGANAGRIYRVLPSGKRVRPIPNLSDQPSAELVKHLTTPNGTLRDLIHRDLIFRGDTNAIPHLQQTFLGRKEATARLYALCILDALGEVHEDIILNALRDRSPHVRRHAIRIAEDRWENRSIRQLVESLVDDPDKHVRYQLALSVGNWKPTFASRTLARLAVRDMANPWIKAAVLSSLPKVSDFVFDAVASTTSDTPGRAAMLADLVGIAAATRHDRLDRMLHPVIPNSTQMDEHDWRLVEKLQDAFDRSRINVNTFMDSFDRASRVTAARLKTIHLKALDTAADPKNSLTLRRSALQMAGRGFNKYDLPRLAGFLDSDQPRELQTDALAAMTRKTSDELAPLLLKNWPTHTPALRQQIITALLRRDTLINGLLDAIEAGTISPGEIDHLTRLRISRRPEEKIIKRAARLIPVQRNTNRAAVVKKYAAALKLNGDPERGKEVFQQQCASCHKLNGIGHHVGPDLAVYRNKNAGDILEAILDPNSVIEPRFTQYEIETKGGETHAGIIQTDSTAGLTLLQAQGVIQQIKRSNIESLRASILSIMPEGLEQAISHSQMSHLMAFLKSR